MKKTKKEVINSIIIILTFTFNIIVFAPIEIFYTNKNDFWFKLADILPVIIALFAIVTILLGVVAILLKNKKKEIFLKIIFVLTLGLYIQGNFLNFGYKVLDGSEIQWNLMIGKGMINTAIWILIISLPYIFTKLKKEKQYKKISVICSIFILLIEIITLLVLGLSERKGDNIELVNKDIFNLSKNKNVVVFMSDTFEGTYMNKILEEYPEYKEKLKDFTYFDNCTGVSFYTYSSMPTLLTGVTCKVGNTLEENVKYCFDNSILYKELSNNNYDINIYTEKALKNYNEYISNLEKITTTTSLEAEIKISNKMYKYCLYRYLPHFLKPSFVVNSDEFYEVKKLDGATPYNKKTYFLDDVAFNKELTQSGITTNNNKNVFKFYQTNGLHMPYNTKADLEYDYSEEYCANNTESERRIEEGLASLNLLCNYVKELKDKGIYDNTTIIFLADHGFENRFYTTLLVKKANKEQDFKISSAPVSLNEDLVPTILNLATDSKNYGKDFFDYKENEERKRKVYDFTYKSNFFDGNTYRVISKIVFETNGLAKNKDSFYMVDEEYENEDKQLTEKYKFGETLKISEAENLNCIKLVGFVLEKIDISSKIGSNINKNTYITINTMKSENDVNAEFLIGKVYDTQQIINFKINDEIIYTCQIKDEDQNKKIVFKIPKDIWNKEEELTIKMEFPEAKWAEYNKTMTPAITLEEVVFK